MARMSEMKAKSGVKPAPLVISRTFGAPGATYVTVWRRAADPMRPDDDSAVFTLPVPHLQGVAAIPDVLYPDSSNAEVSWDSAGGQLAVVLPRAPSACLIRVGTGNDGPGDYDGRDRLAERP